MGLLTSIFGEDRRGYNFRAIEYANSIVEKYRQGDFIVVESFSDGQIDIQTLYRIVEIELGDTRGKNTVIKLPHFLVEDVLTGDTVDLIRFRSYTTKTGTPTPCYHAEVWPFAVPHEYNEAACSYSESLNPRIRVIDKVEMKQLLELEKERLERERKYEEIKNCAKELRSKRNESISSEEILKLVQDIRKI